MATVAENDSTLEVCVTMIGATLAGQVDLILSFMSGTGTVV